MKRLKEWLASALRFTARPLPAYKDETERQQFDQDCIDCLGYKGDELVMLTEHDLFKIWRAGAQRARAEAELLATEPPLLAPIRCAS